MNKKYEIKNSRRQKKIEGINEIKKGKRARHNNAYNVNLKILYSAAQITI